ncbi:integrase family protein [Variovorax sp. J22P240]|uniref:integrase family protein n=1 Tax=Variovorax sp. J22P240 TaxID=3053514 RepID=UPI002576B17E|nr:integrase family protein [Variovorax sp. J22P240]MDM0002701.1 integrase family protein [Variovorax sp. J22P240]
MARPKKTEAPDTTQRVNLTNGVIERLTCQTDRKAQAFLRDSEAPGLRVRVSNTGAKSFVFEGKLNRHTIRRVIGDVRAWTIEQARTEARRLAVMLDSGIDPREVELQKQARNAADAKRLAADALTVGEAWSRYIAERRPHWGERNYVDHVKMTHEGGEDRKRLPGVKTKAGPLAELMALRLVDLTPVAVEQWASKEAPGRPARVRLALRLLKAFLRWAAAEPDMNGKADPTAASAKKAREAAGKPQTKNDYLQREQLATWFKHVRAIPNPIISAYLQCLLLTGARREELAALRWEDVNFQWKGMSLRDKIEGQRAVPLTPYVGNLMTSLPRRNEWVFSSAQAIDLSDKNARRREQYHARKGQTAPAGDVTTRSASGRIVEPGIAHRQACAAAGLGGLTLHGLRRSFASLCEWLDIPGGISAQIQGHAPQGVREQNYIRRPLDLLRVHHERIEAWMLEQAGVVFVADAQPSALRVLAASR